MTDSHANSIEQAVLGAILYDNAAFQKIKDAICADHFYDPAHRIIFEKMEFLINKGHLADAIVLKNQFSQEETLNDIGGVEYLALLLSRPCIDIVIGCKIIVDFGIHRNMVNECRIAADEFTSRITAIARRSYGDMSYGTWGHDEAVKPLDPERLYD